MSIENEIYVIGDNVKVSDITVDEESQQIKLGITMSEKSVLRYSIITEEI
jgi:ribosomal protein S1